MNIPVKKLKNGFEMPVYGLGTWQMGGRNERDINNNDEADIKAIRDAIDAGITHIDTAEAYADGYTEELICKAIKDYDRSKLLIVSKARIDNLSYDDLIKSCKASLNRLGTKYLDLYLCHRYNPGIPLKETMSAMETLLEEGLIKNIGVSNFNVSRLEEAQANTKYKIVCNQVHLNLKYRESEKKGVLKYCQDNDIMFVAWRPTQKGVLLEKVSPIVQEMCKKYNKLPVQIAINWLISQDHVVTLSKTTNRKHLMENLGAVDWKMQEADIERLRNEFPNQEFISDAVPID
jgi:diketogulonate reductase-like aldo/keto reductase